MISLQQARASAGPPQHNDKIVRHNNSVHDTFNFIKSQVTKTANQTAGFAQSFVGPTKRDTAKNIFDFLKTNIAYVKDSPENEQVRTPARLLADAKGDCDCYSMFILSVLYNLKIQAKLKMVKINGGADYQHIYVIMPDTASPKGYWVIDPVLSSFDQEAPGISGTQLGGIEDTGISVSSIYIPSFDLLPVSNNISSIKNNYAIK